MSPHGTGMVSQDELQLDKNVITALNQVMPFQFIYFPYRRILFKATINQLRNLVKDCHLPDSSDDFLITWLKGTLKI